jgi:mannose-1-phosphate guanylyltransferase/phosphomannomutase
MTSINLDKMFQYHQQKKAQATFIVHKSSHPYDSELVDVDDNWQVKGFLNPPKPGDNFRNLTKSGTVIFEPEVLKYVPTNQIYSIEKELLPDLIQKKEPVFAYYSEEYSQDMGTPERLAKVRKDFQNGKIII